MRVLTPVVSLLALGLSSCSAEAQICGRMETLCGTPREDCKALVRSTADAFGEEGVGGLKACFADAKSCSEATGCVAGRGLQGLTGAATDFLQGVMKGLEQKK